DRSGLNGEGLRVIDTCTDGEHRRWNRRHTGQGDNRKADGNEALDSWRWTVGGQVTGGQLEVKSPGDSWRSSHRGTQG
ncbi:hypothetical protein ACLOJK_039621, partial [Asimina triloba]